ncbi:MAG: hypothetical protein ACREPE_12840 [Lysobacter sp.]
MNQAIAAPQAQRIEVIDALRGLALLGVLVNLLTEFRDRYCASSSRLDT